MLISLWAFAVLSVINGMLVLVSYITHNTFPQPLSEEEEARFLKLLANGNEEARNVLVEHNLRLVAHIVKKFDNTGEDNDDLISIGAIGLIKAINTYNLEKGSRLATYAARCIENEILMHLRLAKKIRSEVSLYDPVGFDREGNEITLIDILGTHPEIVPEIVENKLNQSNLLRKIERLSLREKKVLQLRFGLNNKRRQTQREIARTMGISRSYVSRIEKRALAKLVKDFNPEINNKP
jgi:RNA polymerase sporulation-specific sigma factor